MQSEYIYPDLGDRSSPNAWEEAGKPKIVDRAVARRDKILATHFPKHISDEVDEAVRKRFPIALSPAAVGR